MLYFIFFFKQKTAYEMRISDWSSDVCSSDLAELKAIQEFAKTQGVEAVACEHWGKGSEGTEELAHKVVALADGGTANFKPLYDEKRSEEHTSELQSLMRNSYAVFCLKKKNIQNNLIERYTE